MKKWLQNNFLPMWAKETVLWDNRRLKQENLKLQTKIDELEAYVLGLKTGLRTLKHVGNVSRGERV